MAWVGTDSYLGTDPWHDAINPTPINFTATPASSTQINLSWTAIPAASGYDIEKDGVVIVYGQTATTYSDSGLTAGVSHTYRVRAVD